MKRKENYASKHIGKKIMRLTILRWIASEDRCAKVEAECECGVIKTYTLSTILNGVTGSCGCYRKEQARKACTKHDLHHHPLKHIWRAMLDRCYQTNHKQYHNYGGRGVVVCEEWKNSFPSFYDWCVNNGWQKGLQIDKDIVPKKLGVEAKLYCPEYCSFVTRKENMRERTNSHFLTHEGMTFCISEWAERKGIKYATIIGRLEKGWSVEAALNTPILSNDRIVDYNGELVKILDLCERIGINSNTFRGRLCRGWAVDRIMNTPARKHNKRTA
jgi:hypothetical protein